MSEEKNVDGVVAPIVVEQPTVDAVTPIAQTEAVVIPVAPQVATTPVAVAPLAVATDIDPFEAMFTGTAVMDSAPELNTVTMEDGIAQVRSVTLETSKGGHPMVVINFGDVNCLDEASKGHIEYISCTDGWRWKSTIERVRHLVTHSGNALVLSNFNACFAVSPFTTLKNDLGQPVQLTDWKQLDALKEQLKDDSVTAIFFDKKDKVTRTAVKFRNPLEFCTNLNTAFQGLIGAQFELKLTTDKRDFQRVKKYLPLTV